MTNIEKLKKEIMENLEGMNIVKLVENEKTALADYQSSPSMEKYMLYRAYFELVRENKEQPEDSRVTFGVVYPDGSEGTVKAKSVNEVLDLVPEGSQVF